LCVCYDDDDDDDDDDDFDRKIKEAARAIIDFSNAGNDFHKLLARAQFWSKIVS
jgi:hypothetical protein